MIPYDREGATGASRCNESTHPEPTLNQQTSAMANPPIDFGNIRQWRGSQNQAFEELCYQLRDPTPEGAELIKTGNPDGGLEWYVQFPDGSQWGWQAKYSFPIDNLLKGMEKSLRTVVEKRPNCRRLTFCIPFDLPEAIINGRKSARQKFEDKKKSWYNNIPGANQVCIKLWSGGDLLQRLVDSPGQRGIIRFFWNREVFSQQWCEKQMSIAQERAGGRYSPKLHVDVPVSFALEGLALSEAYKERFQDARNQVLQAAEPIQVSNYIDLDVAEDLHDLKNKLSEWKQATPEKITMPRRLEQSNLLDFTCKCKKLIDKIYFKNLSQDQRKQQKDDIKRRVSSCKNDLWQLNGTLRDFEDLLSSDASHAAANGALLIYGEAGQGKTHLFCDVGKRAVEAGQPAVVILGGSLSGRDVWSEIAKQLGLGAEVGSGELVSTMQAAAEASNAPFLLLIDALNEAKKPKAWRDELPRLFAEIANNPWISVAVSVRSIFLDIVRPDDGLDNVIEVEHPGFDGQELEATECFFDAFGLEQPRIPLLMPQFTNPLFLKLYCESLNDMGLSAPPLGEAYLSQIFEQYLGQKEKRIAQHLEMDSAMSSVQNAINSFCTKLVEIKCESLPYQEASNLINTFGNESRKWPNTLFGQLLSEGVLSCDVGWVSEENLRKAKIVRFTYQQFADYQVASILLDRFGSNVNSLKQALSPGQPLRQTILDAPPNWLEALAVLVPERFGIELQDVATWNHSSEVQHSWDTALVNSIKIRKPSATTEKTCDLLAVVRKRSSDLGDLMLEVQLSVATQPDHLLNAYSLHEALKAASMPRRDVGWSIPTYYTLDEGGPLDRLIRWASRSRRPDCPRDVVELAAITLAWTFTSPNRILRDCATKALSQLLSDHLPVLPTLIPRFAGVNDPYVIERLAVACHGAVLCGGTSESQTVVNAAGELQKVVFADDQVPNILARDAVRGIYEWCLQNKWIDEQMYSEVKPPYSSTPPLEPLVEEDIIHNYESKPKSLDRSYRSLLNLLGSSILTTDFGRYVVGSAMHRFTQHPLGSAMPPEDQRSSLSGEWGRRWIFQRVISLGWRPEYFGKFDSQLDYFGRTDHKPERFGKKYQWIALHELMARIADNFHMRPEYDEEPVVYEGPWQLRSRDIDPTLPPPLRKTNVDNVVEVDKTFSQDSGHWWVPCGPCYREDDLSIGNDWGTKTHDIPELESLVRCEDSNGNRWIVLYARYTWANELGSLRTKCRYFWSHIKSWLIRPKQRNKIINYLEQQTFMGQWMPEAAEQASATYLGELPWAAASLYESGHCWGTIERDQDRDSIGSAEAYSAWGRYFWESNVRDCSIDHLVEVCYPAPILFNNSDLIWLPGRREWQGSEGTTVAQFVENEVHCSLLVREDWLQQTLHKIGLAMIFGWLGEKRLFGKGDNVRAETLGDWTEINAVASLEGKRWIFGQRRLERRSKLGSI